MSKISFVDSCERNELEVVKKLIKNGIDPHQLDEAGLRKAVYHGAYEVVEFLLSIGCDKYACDSASFIMAAGRGHLNIVELLYQGNKNVDEQQRGLEEAVQYGHIDIVDYLLSIGANIHYNNDLVLKYTDSLSMIQHLVGLGCNVKYVLNHKNKQIKIWAQQYHDAQQFSLTLDKELTSSTYHSSQKKI